jgi:hypothetical protein
MRICAKGRGRPGLAIVGVEREFASIERVVGLAEACKLLIKWKYLYLSQKLEGIKDTAGCVATL